MKKKSLFVFSKIKKMLTQTGIFIFRVLLITFQTNTFVPANHVDTLRIHAWVTIRVVTSQGARVVMVTSFPVATLEVVWTFATLVFLAIIGHEMTFLFNASDVVKTGIFAVDKELFIIFCEFYNLKYCFKNFFINTKQIKCFQPV